jgi:hypothetical protein
VSKYIAVSFAARRRHLAGMVGIRHDYPNLSSHFHIEGLEGETDRQLSEANSFAAIDVLGNRFTFG